MGPKTCFQRSRFQRSGFTKIRLPQSGFRRPGFHDQASNIRLPESGFHDQASKIRLPPSMASGTKLPELGFHDQVSTVRLPRSGFQGQASNDQASTRASKIRLPESGFHDQVSEDQASQIRLPRSGFQGLASKIRLPESKIHFDFLAVNSFTDARKSITFSFSRRSDLTDAESSRPLPRGAVSLTAARGGIARRRSSCSLVHWHRHLF